MAPVLSLLLCVGLGPLGHAAGEPEKPAAPAIPPAVLQQAQAIIAARPETDAIVFKDSADPLYARITKITPEALTAEKAAAGGVAAKAFLLTGITEVRLPLTRTEQAVLERHDAVAVPLQRAFWELRKPLLGIPSSNVGEWGLALALSLRVVGTAPSREEARTLAVLIADKEGDPARQRRASDLVELLDFEKLLASGKSDEILAAAGKALERGDEANEDLLLLAVPTLAKHEFETLKAIEKENPRWMDDDEVKPERDRHYNLALDMFLHAYLFHGSRFVEAAEGLWNASQVYLHESQPEKANACLKDIAYLYPTTPHAAEAETILKKAGVQAAPPPATPPAAAKGQEKYAPPPTKPAPPVEKKNKLFNE